MRYHQSRSWQTGFSLIELMIAMTLGVIVLGGLFSMFGSSSRAYNELKKSAEHTGNGSLAMWLMSQDISHAGYYGEFYVLPATGAALPDPCLMSTADLYASLAFPIQGYNAPAASPLTCLDNANFVPGTDIVVVRHAEVFALGAADVPVTGEVYVQAASASAEVQIGAGATAIGTSKKADGSAATIFRKDGVTAAEIRKLVVSIYFVAPCSVPADGSDTCTGAADDGGRPIPTLKRLELTSVGGATAWRIMSLVDGVRNLQIDYGVDSLPAAVDLATNQFGDGAPDSYVTAPSLAQWSNVVSVRISFVAQSTQFTSGYTDTKTYNLGLAGNVGPYNDAFKKHLFVGAARLNVVSGRREIPR